MEGVDVCDPGKSFADQHMHTYVQTAPVLNICCDGFRLWVAARAHGEQVDGSLHLLLRVRAAITLCPYEKPSHEWKREQHDHQDGHRFHEHMVELLPM